MGKDFVNNVRDDLGANGIPRSSEHTLRLIVSCVMFLFGFSIIIIHYVLTFLENTSSSHDWSREELLLVLVLVIGAVGILFTRTLLAILKVVWPFQGGRK